HRQRGLFVVAVRIVPGFAHPRGVRARLAGWRVLARRRGRCAAVVRVPAARRRGAASVPAATSTTATVTTAASGAATAGATFATPGAAAATTAIAASSVGGPRPTAVAPGPGPRLAVG